MKPCRCVLRVVMVIMTPRTEQKKKIFVLRVVEVVYCYVLWVWGDQKRYHPPSPRISSGTALSKKGGTKAKE